MTKMFDLRHGMGTPVNLSKDAATKVAQIEPTPDPVVESGGLNAWRIAVELTIPVERAVDNQAALADFKKILNSVFGGDTGLMHYHILELPKKVADV